MTIKVSCGCMVAIDPEWGIQHCVKKCEFHKEWVRNQPADEAYYKMLGTINMDGTPNMEPAIREFINGFGELIDAPHPDATLLEVGCGASMYTQYILDKGWNYKGIEANKWAADWTHHRYNVPVTHGLFPYEYDGGYGATDAILCAHTLEHMDHAPHGLFAMRDILRKGGIIYIIIPDNTDLANPDHFWFFTPDQIVKLMERAGFQKVELKIQQVVEREKFLYCKGIK